MMIDIDHVSFQYSGAEQENLQDFNLQIKKGECVVLTGESGCGKTCVTRLINTLIPHFYEGEMSGAVSLALTSQSVCLRLRNLRLAPLTVVRLPVRTIS